MGCTGPNSDVIGIEDVREISKHPSISQLQEKFRVPCVFQRTVSGLQRIITREIAGAMDLSPKPIVEVFSRLAEKSKVLLTSFLKLPSVKALQFSLALGLSIVRTVIPSQKNDFIMPLPPVYTLRDDNIFRLDLQAIHMKAVKAEDAKIDTAIWDDDDEEMLQGGHRAKRQETIFQNLRNIMDNPFKRNMDRNLCVI